MADWAESVELDLTQGDREWAREVAVALKSMSASGRLRDQRASSYWTSYEIDFYGHLGEAGVARLMGEPLTSLDVIRGRNNDGGVDLPGTGVGIKCSPWRCVEHFHLAQGGRLIVPLRHYGLSEVYVLCSYFLKSGRLFLDGYATADMFRSARRLRSNTGKPAMEIPYRGLLPAARFVEIIGRRARSARP